MPLTLHNTLTGKKELFEPSEAKHVRIYVCGPTVYDYFHIGNARAFVVFDTLRRLFLRRGHRVTFVQNITDVDDKIINRANQEGRSAQAVAKEFTAAFFEDIKALGCLPADVAPKATEHMAEIIGLVRRLVDGGHAYALDGDVYFSVRSFPGYGRISHKNIEELEQGARVEIDARKRDPLDFALWKAAKPGEPFWESPWGPGRPGWHIECSAMSMKYLGESFDIHGGGEDLIFPHHENENAQSESVTGKPLARVWLHNGFLKIDGEKMSKSLGNFRIVRDLLKAMPCQGLRMFLLSAHYRSPLEFNADNIQAILNSYVELQRTLERLREIIRLTENAPGDDDAEAKAFDAGRAEAVLKFDRFLDDDLNTAGALGQIFILANSVKKLIAGKSIRMTRMRREALMRAQDDLVNLCGVLGMTPDVSSIAESDRLLIAEREAARVRKDWAEADRIRAVLKQHNVELEDTVYGTLATTGQPVGVPLNEVRA